MAAPNTTQEFLSLVSQSGLVEIPTLQAYVKERLASGGVPANPRRMAQDMLSDGMLTKFQAEQILMGRYRKFELAGKYRLLERVGEGGAAALGKIWNPAARTPAHAAEITPRSLIRPSIILARRAPRVADSFNHNSWSIQAGAHARVRHSARR